MTPLELVAIAAAGGLGAVVRFLAGALLLGRAAGRGGRRSGARHVRATLAVNLVASLLAGLAASPLIPDPTVRALIVTGFCGGLSTYSAFAVQVVEQGEDRRSGAAALTIAATVVGGAIAAALGLLVGALLVPGHAG